MKKRLLCLFFSMLFIKAACYSLDLTTPLKYTLKTHLNAQAEAMVNFELREEIQFECTFDAICPITQIPESLTLTFTSIKGQVTHQDQTLFFNSDQKNDLSFEHQSIQKILYQPVCIDLNRDLTINGPVLDFQHLLKLSALDNYFISQDLLHQIVETLFAPVKAKEATPLTLSLHYPFKTRVEVFPQLNQGASSIQYEQKLALEGLYSEQSAPRSLLLNGELFGAMHWQPNQFYAEHFSLNEKVQEDNENPLFEKPLSFQYSLNLDLEP